MWYSLKAELARFWVHLVFRVCSPWQFLVLIQSPVKSKLPSILLLFTLKFLACTCPDQIVPVFIHTVRCTTKACYVQLFAWVHKAAAMLLPCLLVCMWPAAVMYSTMHSGLAPQKHQCFDINSLTVYCPKWYIVKYCLPTFYSVSSCQYWKLFLHCVIVCIYMYNQFTQMCPRSWYVTINIIFGDQTAWKLKNMRCI